LQALVNDAAAQLQLSYRQDPLERKRRHEELGRAIEAWNKSARGAAENERLAEWLRRMMQASMPGSHDELPALPEFARPTPPKETAPAIAPATASPATPSGSGSEAPKGGTAEETKSRADDDPFRDDPIQDVPTHKAAVPDDPFRDDPLGVMPHQGDE
jgi:hypothetical protein